MISIKLNEEEMELVESFAKAQNISLSELFIKAVMEKIEDENDIQEYRESLREYNQDPTTYSHEEVRKILGI